MSNMFDFSCDESIVCTWCESYEEMARCIYELSTDRGLFRQKMNEIISVINQSMRGTNQVQWRLALGPFAVFELLSKDGSVEQKLEIQKIILKSFGVSVESLITFPTIAPAKYNARDLSLLEDVSGNIQNWSYEYYAQPSNGQLFDECPLSSDFKRTLTSWLYMASPKIYIGLDDWAREYLKTCYVDVYHHDPISVEFSDVVSGEFTWDRYEQFLWAMQDPIANSRIITNEYFAYAAYRRARYDFFLRERTGETV